MARGAKHKFTLGKDVTLNTMRAACLEMSRPGIVVVPLHRAEPGIDVVSVGESRYQLPASLSLRLTPDSVWMSRQVRSKMRRGEPITVEDQTICHGLPGLRWPSNDGKWVEARANDVAFGAGIRVEVEVRHMECVPGEWIFELLDAFVKAFDGTDIVRYTAANKKWLRTAGL
jgi:hypothetical protein